MRVPGIPFVQGRNDYADSDGLKWGIAIHNTSNDASDEGEAAYATRRTDGISAHFYCDGDSVIQSLDTADCAGHSGSREGNQNAIAVEITGANGWTRAQWLANVAWDQLGRVLAVVIRHHWGSSFAVRRASVAEMEANPRVKAFYGHNDMRLAWGGTTHTDPGPNFPWDRLITAVNTALTPQPIQEDDVLTTAQDNALAEAWALSTSLRDGTPTPKAGNDAGGPAWLVEQVTKLTAMLAELVARPAPEAVVSDAQVDRIAAALIAATDVPLGEADKPAIVAAVKQAAREGTG